MGNVAYGDYNDEKIFSELKDNLFLGGGIDISYDTLLGPLSFTIGYNNWNERLTYDLNIGYRFVFD